MNLFPSFFGRRILALVSEKKSVMKCLTARPLHSLIHSSPWLAKTKNTFKPVYCFSFFFFLFFYLLVSLSLSLPYLIYFNVHSPKRA
jgi:hypothetical protein